MIMKVLAKGTGQKGWAKKHTCTGNGNGEGGCGAKLLVEEGDLFQTQRNCLHETDYFVTFKCPECGVLTDIDNYPGRATELPRQRSSKGHREPHR
jgi:hypothetical protein